MKKVLMALAIMTMGIGCLADEMECVQLWEGGPYWATENLHGTGPAAYHRGDYYWWGSVLGYTTYQGQVVSTDDAMTQTSVEFAAASDYTNPTYNCNNSPQYGHGSYDALQKAGYTYIPDGATRERLTPEHDAATQALGSGWRIPTKEDFENLIANCTAVRATYEDRNGADWEGYEFEGKGDYVGKKVFFGKTVGRLARDANGETSYAFYWTSTPQRESDYYDGCRAYMFRLGFTGTPRDDNPQIKDKPRYQGLYIRPVRDTPPPSPPKGVTIIIR